MWQSKRFAACRKPIAMMSLSLRRKLGRLAMIQLLAGLHTASRLFGYPEVICKAQSCSAERSCRGRPKSQGNNLDFMAFFGPLSRARDKWVSSLNSHAYQLKTCSHAKIIERLVSDAQSFATPNLTCMPHFISATQTLCDKFSKLFTM